MTVNIRPSTRCYPRDDTEFADDVASALDQPESDWASVVAVLREKYPQVRIVERDALASAAWPDEEAPVWYCYRDGAAVV
jgi:hypothetical protein